MKLSKHLIALAATLPAIALATMAPTGAQQGHRQKPPISGPINSIYKAYIIPQPVDWIMVTDPERTIARHGIPFTPLEQVAVAARDNTVLNRGIYHLFKLPYRKGMSVEWTGYADGNHQVYLSYWNGEDFVTHSIRDAQQKDTYRIAIRWEGATPPQSAYVLVNCTRGDIYTDHITADAHGSSTAKVLPPAPTARGSANANGAIAGAATAPQYFQYNLFPSPQPSASKEQHVPGPSAHGKHLAIPNRTSMAVPAAIVQRTFEDVMAIIKNNDYQTLMVRLDDNVKPHHTAEAFDKIVTLLAPRLKHAYKAMYVANVKKDKANLHLWQLSFTNGGDDVVVAFSLNETNDSHKVTTLSVY